MSSIAVGTADPVAGRLRVAPLKTAWLLLMAAGTAAALRGPWEPLPILASAALTAVLLCAGHSVGLHRAIIHRAWIPPDWLRDRLAWMATLAGLGGPLELARYHEIRDWAQRAPACHPHFGHRGSVLGDVVRQLTCEVVLDRPPAHIPLVAQLRLIRPLRDLQRTWMAQQLWIALPAAFLGGWTWFLWLVPVRVFVGLVMHQVVGHLAHRVGHQHGVKPGRSTQGYNVPVLGVLSFGEGWHNNHHQHPESARLGLAPGEWDAGWLLICALRRMGLARGVQEARITRG